MAWGGEGWLGMVGFFWVWLGMDTLVTCHG